MNTKTNGILQSFLGALLGFIGALFFINFYTWYDWQTFSIFMTLVGFTTVGSLGAYLLVLGENFKISLRSTKLLEEDHDAKSKFVSFASHEIKKPLTTIKLTLKSLLQEEFGPLTKEQKELIAAIYNESIAMETIARTFLDISKIDLHALEISLKPMRVDEFEKIVSGIVEKRQVLADKEHIVMSYTAQVNRSKIINIDQTALHLAVENLVENAIHYTPSGGTIAIALRTEAHKIIFSISDTGIGITERDKSRIFHEFFRAENAKKFKFTGSGVGLYLCKKYIEGHGGTITFSSEENTGTMFTFTIPLSTGSKIEDIFRKI